MKSSIHATVIEMGRNVEKKNSKLNEKQVEILLEFTKKVVKQLTEIPEIRPYLIEILLKIADDLNEFPEIRQYLRENKLDLFVIEFEQN